ncbi:hypothetical protein H0H81_001936 [Sphagnurus paluster]|uniref:Uncharacterized protein n=1 Tax=Sphagnurus paluster TaxID=117069 RepID=A0A9P7GGZ3_9AGAR|nr:hypothetical protein H0H81_001936 [Sphagnurus paluster]
MESGHLFDGNRNPILLSAGEDISSTQYCEVAKQLEDLTSIRDNTLFGIYDEPGQMNIDEEDPTVMHFVNLMRDLGIETEEEDENEVDDPMWSPEEISEWSPHGSKTMFMLDLLDNLPRLRLSDDHLKAIIWVMRECGTPNVPSFSSFRKMQSDLTKEFGISPKLHTSSLGNHFYMNHPAKLLALDWANPLVRSSIHVYPELKGPVSELWQASKWLDELDEDENSPMWADWESVSKRHRHYYVKELAQLEDLRVYPATSLSRNVLDLQKEFKHLVFSEQFTALREDFDPTIWNEAYDYNPQQSETSSHIGVNGNYNCRRDLTGGTEAEKETDEVYQKLYKTGQPRTAEATIQSIKWQVWTACSGNQEALQTHYAASGVKDKISQYWIDILLSKAKEQRAYRVTNIDTRDA